MASSKLRLNRKGVSQILRTQCAGAINDLAEQVAASVRSQVDDGIDVEVSRYTTDRGAAAVVIADPSGMELQARGGVLTRAAAAQGLEVKSK